MSTTKGVDNLLERLDALEKENTDVKEQNLMYCQFFQQHCDNKLQEEKLQYQTQMAKLHKQNQQLETQLAQINAANARLKQEFDDKCAEYAQLRESLMDLKLEFSVAFA